MNFECTCCFTGHRDFPAAYADTIRSNLYAQVTQTIGNGYTNFLCGFARGADLLFAEAVLLCKEEFSGITLGAVLPYEQRRHAADPFFAKLLAACDTVIAHSPAYTPHSFLQRDRMMVDRSRLIIALYDGRSTGGTLYTLRYAQRLGRETLVLQPDGSARIEVQMRMDLVSKDCGE